MSLLSLYLVLFWPPAPFAIDMGNSKFKLLAKRLHVAIL
jgi:hypothetical protein